MITVSGCSTGNVNVSERAVCDGLDPLVDAHAEGLVTDGGPVSLLTGRVLISGFDGACSGV